MRQPEPDDVAIGSLRWVVTIATRTQAPQTGGTGIAETLVPLATVHADIQSVGALTFWNGQQTDTPVTHRIRMRWQDYLDNTKVITRQTTRLDGTTRTEIFRIRQVREMAGRKRFAELFVELESAK